MLSVLLLDILKKLIFPLDFKFILKDIPSPVAKLLNGILDPISKDVPALNSVPV